MNELELNLEKISMYAKARESENLRFRSFLKGQDSDKIDNMIHRINEEVSASIDCTKCGNCCNHLCPEVDSRDIDRLSNVLNVTPEKFRENYVMKEEGEDYLKHTPCRFLKDKMCTVYEIRPNSCRDYPYLHKDYFISRLFGVLNNYSICPIVYNSFERLKRELRFK